MKELETVIGEKKEFKEFCENFKNGKLSHAFLLLGEDNAQQKAFYNLASILITGDEIKVRASSHADVNEYAGESFLTLDSENLISKLHLKPLECDYKVFIINVSQELSGIVQNKLLKTLEEPPKNTFIFICGKFAHSFLPTVRSRMQTIVLKPLTKQEFSRFYKGADLEEKFELCGGNISLLNSLSDKRFMQKFSDVQTCLENMQKSSEVILYSRKLAKDKQDISQSLEILELVFKRLIDASISKQKFFSEKISNNYSLKTVAHVVDLIKQSKQEVFANCSPAAVCDNLLLKILEVKFKCQQNLL